MTSSSSRNAVSSAAVVTCALDIRGLPPRVCGQGVEQARDDCFGVDAVSLRLEVHEEDAERALDLLAEVARASPNLG